MVKKDQEIAGTPILSEIIKKSLAFLLLFSSISLVLILITFNPLDTGWGIVSETLPTNLYKEIGAWLSGFIIKEFGVFPGLLLCLILFIWSLKLFNNSVITFLKTKLSAIFLVIFLSSLGGTYLETVLVKTFNINFSIINQRGLSEWFLLYLSNGLFNIFSIDLMTSELILGVGSFFISLILFSWILSLGPSEVKFIKFDFIMNILSITTT